MNKNIKKLFAVCLCALLLWGDTFTAFALADIEAGETEAKSEEAPVVTGEKSGSKNEKDETVYILADADGSIQKIIVSDWIKNMLGEATISDQSELTDIENVKGNENCSEEGDFTVWDADGNDIYYQGNIEKELPVGMTVTYTLDGNELSPAEIAGKSGRVCIRFDYENNQYEMTEIAGKQEKIHVPFAMLTGILLDNEGLRNVEVKNGKLVNDGDRSVIIGIAFPGLQENLAVDRDKLNIPDYLEITADVTDFSLGMTFTVATNELFSNMDGSLIISAGELTDKLNELTDSLAELTDGMNQLNAGTETLLSGGNKLSDGIRQLSEGLNTLTSNNNALIDGAKQVFETLLNAANAQIQASGTSIPVLTTENYAAVLDNALGAISTENVSVIAQQQVETAVRAQEDAIRSTVASAVQAEVETQVMAAVRQSVLEQVLAVKGISADIYTALSEEQKLQLDTAVDQQMTSDEVTAILLAQTTEQMASDSVKELIDAKTEEQIQMLIQQNMESSDVQAQISAGIAQAEAGTESLCALKAQLDGYSSFYQGLINYTAGVESAANGAAQLKASMPEFVSGVQQLCDGTNNMLYGLSSADLGNFNVAGVYDRLKATADAAKNYQNFSGISKEMNGKVKFIFRTEPVQ